MPNTDPRIDVIRNAQRTHMFASAGVQHGKTEEHWRCRCGLAYFGEGAIERGHRHAAAEVLSALDNAVAVA